MRPPWYRRRRAFVAVCLVLAFLLLRPLHEPRRKRPPDAPPAPDAAPSPSARARQVRVAYFLQISNASLPLVPRLLRAIHRPEDFYLIHLDTNAVGKRGDAELRRLLRGPEFGNVRFLSPAQITYRGVSMVLNTVDAIEHMLLWSRDWTHFVNLSGNCYPLLLPGDLAAALAEASVSSAGAPLDVSFVSFWDPVLRWKMLSLDPALSGNATHGSIWQPGMEFSPLPYPYDGVIPYPFEPAVPVPHGDAWVILSRAFCASLFRNGRELRRLLAFFSTVPSPAEHFFQAWIRWTQAGLQLNATVAPDALRFFDFPPLSQHPAPMTRREQLEAAVEAGAAFARKFPEGSPLLDAVDGMSAEERGRARRNAVRRMRWAVEKTLAYGEPVR